MIIIIIIIHTFLSRHKVVTSEAVAAQDAGKGSGLKKISFGGRLITSEKNNQIAI